MGVSQSGFFFFYVFTVLFYNLILNISASKCSYCSCGRHYKTDVKWCKTWWCITDVYRNLSTTKKKTQFLENVGCQCRRLFLLVSHKILLTSRSRAGIIKYAQYFYSFPEFSVFLLLIWFSPIIYPLIYQKKGHRGKILTFYWCISMAEIIEIVQQLLCFLSFTHIWGLLMIFCIINSLLKWENICFKLNFICFLQYTSLAENIE